MIRLNLAIIMLFAVAVGTVSYSFGQDFNFDQLNYHYYVADAFWTQRAERDVAPGQLTHSFFSPFVYLPFYFMVRQLRPETVGTILGAVQGLNFWLVCLIAWIVTRGEKMQARVGQVIAALLISVASPMAISEIGTSFSDLLLSIPVLGALALVLREPAADRIGLSAASRIGSAGALLGAAVSLKLTNAPFAIGLAAGTLVGWNGWRQRATALSAVLLGNVLGFAAVGGIWYQRMWRTFHNPFFPYFNNIFRSPDYQTQEAALDARYLPHGVLDALSFPLDWANITHGVRAELPFRDIRFMLLGVLAVIAFATMVASRREPRSSVPTPHLRLVAFFLVPLIPWIILWSIQRYIVVLELLGGPALIVVLRAGPIEAACRGWGLTTITSVIAVFCLLTVKVPDWGHASWTDAWYSLEPSDPAGERPVYFLDGAPLSYVVSEVRPETLIDFIDWENLAAMGDTVFVRRIKQVVADPSRTEFRTLGLGPPSDTFVAALAHFGLKPGVCRTLAGRPATLTECHLERYPAS